MTFTRSELEMIYQYAATDRAATVAGLAEIVPVLKDPLTKAIVKNTIDKLEKIPEPECSCFIVVDILSNDSPVGYKGDFPL